MDWFPWGEEALFLSKDVDLPIFLSIGYSSCHWCHVMEKESFEDPDVAQMINDGFVPIKVDREERPDLDAIYMTAAQVLYGRGGWPLTLFLAPDLTPFFAATYIPKTSGGGMMGMMDLLPAISRIWRERRSELKAVSSQVMEALREQGRSMAGGDLGAEALIGAYESLKASFDTEHGGFGGAPKFPTPHRLTYLLRYWYRTGDADALDMVDSTLSAMRRGGIYDQLGHGLHRYSTDRPWMVPHFEKMLYDQALLAIACVEAWQATGRPLHAHTACQILDYVLGCMTSPEGGFYSAEDADSEGGEGAYYLWTEDEMRSVLDTWEMEMARRAFGTRAEGNVPGGGEGMTGRNILLLNDLTLLSDPDFETMRTKLLNARRLRPRPERDDKVMTDWNGLMIAALARSGGALQESRFVEAAQRAAEHLVTTMLSSSGHLSHMNKEGELPYPGSWTIMPS